jgi:Adipocyte plasma membrane-associated protein-like, N-terminal
MENRVAFWVSGAIGALMWSGCASTCDNAGVSVDGRGSIVVRGENGFTSPNSAILQNVRDWPQPPPQEQNFAFAQGYVLTRDGAMYVLGNTAQHPNLVYRVDLASGHSSLIGANAGAPPPAANAASQETWITADARHAYSVNQKDPVISRADLALRPPTLTPFIAGAKTRLEAPIGVAVDHGRLCALDSQIRYVLCFRAARGGNVAPSTVVDLARMAGYAQVWDLVFDRSGHLVVSGTSDPNGLTGFSINVIDITTSTPRVVRAISGPKADLRAPELGIDALGDILVLQPDSPNLPSNSEILAFGPQQRGDAAPRWIRKPATNLTHAFRIAVDRDTNDIAILGSDGIAFFRRAAARSPNEWPGETRLPARGWSVAFGSGTLLVADEFGAVQRYSARPERHMTRSESAKLNLHDPEFIASDQDGAIYTASSDGVITRFPKDVAAPMGWRNIAFATPFGRNMDAFAADSAGHYYISSGTNDAIVSIDSAGKTGIVSGAKTELNSPLGLAVGGDGKVFVANSAVREILIFGRAASGNTAPIGRIAGPQTELVMPQSLAIGSDGRLYVFDGPQSTNGSGSGHFVRVFSASVRGNVAPIASYPVKTKCWANAP